MTGWLEITLRSFTLLIALFFITRALGKKQLSQLNVFEYISGIVLGGIVAIHSTLIDSPVIYGFIALLIWFIVPASVEYFSIKNKRFRDFVHGKGTVIIQGGKIMEDSLKKEKYSTDDLLENLRARNVFHVADVEFAILEPTGKLNVLPKKEKQPITADDLGIKLPREKEPQTVIMDGEILLDPLASLSLNPNWLRTELEKINVTIENVFLGQVSSDGQLTVDLYDDQIIVPQSSKKALLLATMKKCQADLELFALVTHNKQSKQLYINNSRKLEQAILLVEPYLK